MRVRWSASARSDLLDIIDIVSRDRPLAARVRRAVQGTARNPRIGRMVPEIGDPEIRERIVPPYRVLYRLPNEVMVVAVIHGRRDLHRALDLPGPPEGDEEQGPALRSGRRLPA
jgi:toxin ParE1/3/4